jgi:radical SAM superfamily enzyme YgiQ (UPF0313 family)
MSPDDQIHCLLIQPSFSENNYWNYVEVAGLTGAKTVAPPLGLLTIAAILPQHWEFNLVDLNVREVTQEEWEQADLVCVGGMLPQQPGILAIIEESQRRGKYVAVGGPDPTSQPDVYSHADALVMGEGEATIPLWLQSWRDGQPRGKFEAKDRPQITNSPVPRFDLIDFKNYLHVGVQFSRGCPFNCEFCDIIELYGRIPRSKTTEQMLAELNCLYDLGYRGWIDMVDDNFIGNKRQVKPMLVELEQWSKDRNRPFYFTTEATMNLADDEDLMQKMQNVDFRFIFMGIETPDPELLAVTQKRVNAMKPIVERIEKVYAHGIGISAGFIFGFDNEKRGNDKVMISCIEDTGIIVAMVGLLVALPNTQLTRRLQKEGRLLSPDMELVTDKSKPYQLVNAGKHGDSQGNQAAGLNFITTRDRVEIYREYRHVIETIYSPKVFMDRILSTTRRIKLTPKFQPGKALRRRFFRALLKAAWWMTKNKSVRRYYWRNTLKTLFMGRGKFSFAQSQMVLYMHYEKQSKFVSDQLAVNIDYAINKASYPRQLKLNSLPVIEQPEPATSN